jgi:CRP/FNR family cyclic AMP-dependent transcriptional regulator
MEAAEKLTISGILKKLPVFAGLYPEEYEHIRDICVPANFPTDQVIFKEGDGSPCMYVLLSGEIELSTKDLGIIYNLKPGEIFGEIGLISQKKRTATATTRTPSSLLKINGDSLQLLLGREPRISYAIMRNITLNLSEHIIRMNKTGVLDYIPPNGSPNSPGLRRVNKS